MIKIRNRTKNSLLYIGQSYESGDLRVIDTKGTDTKETTNPLLG